MQQEAQAKGIEPEILNSVLNLYQTFAEQGGSQEGTQALIEFYCYIGMES